jgi:UDP-glucose 4-epimerase
LKVLVTGGFGFIGSNLITELVSTGYEVVTIDNFSTGDARFIPNKVAKSIKVWKKDLASISIKKLAKIAAGCQKIFHLSANADVRGGWINSYRDIEQNIITSYKIAEIAKKLGVSEVIFTSTGCVYGDALIHPTPEDHPMPIQTSLYGNSKVASEGIFSAYTAQGAFRTTILRFVSVLGKNYHHGHVIDFVRKIKFNKNEIQILGDGNQNKSYLDVFDCVRAILSLRGVEDLEIFNVGHHNYITVKESVEIISRRLNVQPNISTQESNRGWIGDSPFTFLDTKKAQTYGWRPTKTIQSAIEGTVDWIMQNDWVLTKKDFRSETRLR